MTGTNVFNSALIQYLLNPNSNVNNSQLITEINNLENGSDDEADNADDLDEIPELEDEDSDNDSIELEDDYDDIPALEDVEVNDDIQTNQNNVIHQVQSSQNNSGISQPTITISGSRYRINIKKHI